MGTASRWQLVDEDDYLANERVADQKHEFVAGVVYAMAGGSVAHNLIASNALIAFGVALRPGPCRAFNSDMRVRIRDREGTRYYYPDAMVVCRSNAPQDSYQDAPTVIVEVLSPETRRTDEDEKRRSYMGIPSLTTLIHLEQEARAAVIFRRTPTGFEREVVTDSGAIELPDLGVQLALDELYEGVEVA